MKDEKERFLENAASVFHQINLLSIKKSFRLLCDMESEVIENFVEKYSDFIIFLLNILDEKRSNELLLRLTDSALVYISEEELRTLLIHEIAIMAQSGRDFTGISLFLDRIDRPQESEEIEDFTGEIMSQAVHYRNRPQKRNFAYLDTLSPERCGSVMRRLIERNLYVGIGLLLFCSDDVLCFVLDELARQKSFVLPRIPAEIYALRLRAGRGPFFSAARGIFNHLPEAVQNLIRRIEDFRAREERGLSEIQAIHAGSDPEITRRKKTIELLASMIHKRDLDIMEVALADLKHSGLIQESDFDMLRSVL
ncbi:MAG: hypothetical protein KDK34_11170 [Leptospiraceae bacterium]|nr:hypothetical protein [Leptospiraceae bacterium]